MRAIDVAHSPIRGGARPAWIRLVAVFTGMVLIILGWSVPAAQADTATDGSTPSISPALGATGLGEAMAADLASAGGVVTSKPDGGPVAGISVKFFDADSDDPNPVATALTGADGRYDIEGLRPGTYQILFEDLKMEYRPTWLGAANTRAEAASVKVAPRSQNPRFDATLTKGWKRKLTLLELLAVEEVELSATAGSISGTVYAGAPQAPLANVKIELFDDYNSTAVAVTVTDGAGQYTFASVVPGYYILRATDGSASGRWVYYPSVSSLYSADVISVSNGQQLTERDFVLGQWGSLSGRVVDSDGKPMEGVSVRAIDPDGEWPGYASTDSEGNFVFKSLVPGHYAISATKPFGYGDYLYGWSGGGISERTAFLYDIASGSTASGVELKLLRRPVGAVSGTILYADATPAANQRVWLYGNNGWRDSSTDESGRYSFDNLYTGIYSVSTDVGPGFWYPGVLTEDDATKIKVVAGTKVRADLSLPALSALSGRVSSADGAPVTSGNVTLVKGSEELISCSLDAAFLNDCGDAPGQYSFRAPAGDYELEIEASGYQDKIIPLTISGDSVLDARLVAAPLSIGGTVDYSGGSLEDLEVGVVDALTGAGYDNSSKSINHNTGSFEFTDLPIGDYLLAIRDWEHRRVVWYGGDSVRTATVIHVTGPADVLGLAFSVPPFAGGPDDDERADIGGRLSVPPGTVATVSAFERMWGVLVGTYEDHRVYIDAEDGTWSALVPTGTYELVIGRSDRLGTAEYREQLRVTGDATHDISLVLGGSLTGRVLDGFGHPVAHAYVVSEASATVNESGDTPSDYTDSDGRWTIGGLSAGSVKATVSPQSLAPLLPARVGAGASYQIALGETTATPDLTLQLGGRLAGRIQESEDYDRQRHVTVSVFSVDGTKLDAQSVQRGMSYDFDGLPIGDVLVSFRAKGMSTQWWKKSASRATATKVRIEADKTTRGITPDLPPSLPVVDPKDPDYPVGTITGKVTSEIGFNGTRYVRAIGEADSDDAIVGSDGTYKLSVRPGKYRVYATLCVGLWMGKSGCLGEKHKLWYPASLRREAANQVSVDVDKETIGIDLTFLNGSVFTTALEPTISGEPKVGKRLTVVPGSWDPAPDRFSYQWLRDGVPIDDATDDTFISTSADIGKKLSVTVTGTKTGYALATATSAETVAVAPLGELMAATPTISGAAAVGATLTVVPGNWGPAGVVFTYQWHRDGKDIPVTDGSYVIQAQDAGTKLSVSVTGQLDGYVGATRTSDSTATIPMLTIGSAPTPTISGTARVGEVLSADPGRWDPAAAALSYEWRRGDEEIGTDSATYRLVGEDAGKTLTVTVVGSALGYSSVSKTSVPTATIQLGTLSLTPTPMIDDSTPTVGQTVSVKQSIWGPEPVTIAYQWYKVSSKKKTVELTSPSAKTASYEVQGTDAGYRLKVKVIGTRLGYTTKEVYSETTSYVAKGSFDSVGAPQVALEGTPRVGKELTATAGQAAPATTDWSYQWYRVKATGKYSAISKATKSSYLLSSSDIGYRLMVRVTTASIGYNPVSRDSEATSVVMAGIVAVTPKLSDTTPVVDQVLSITAATGVGKWAPGTVSPTYKWYVGGAEVDGHDEPTYQVKAADLGKPIKLTVVGSATDYAPLVKTSSSTSKVAAATFTEKGLASVADDGSLLTAIEGHWRPSPDRFSYTWYRDGKAISKATGKTYDRGSSTGEFKVKVTAVKAGYTSASVYSAVRSF